MVEENELWSRSRLSSGDLSLSSTDQIRSASRVKALVAFGSSDSCTSRSGYFAAAIAKADVDAGQVIYSHTRPCHKSHDVDWPFEGEILGGSCIGCSGGVLPTVVAFVRARQIGGVVMSCMALLIGFPSQFSPPFSPQSSQVRRMLCRDGA